MGVLPQKKMHAVWLLALVLALALSSLPKTKTVKVWGSATKGCISSCCKMIQHKQGCWLSALALASLSLLIKTKKSKHGDPATKKDVCHLAVRQDSKNMVVGIGASTSFVGVYLIVRRKAELGQGGHKIVIIVMQQIFCCCYFLLGMPGGSWMPHEAFFMQVH